MNIESVYFIGIGGIGMSALARYYKMKGLEVGGYDRTPTVLTRQLEEEGIAVHFADKAENIPEGFKDSEKTLVIYTPAVSDSSSELNYFRLNHFEVIKRAEALGRIIQSYKGIAVSGSHGKTTISGMIAHIMGISDIPASAFLGGISKNLNSNLMLTENPEFIVVEADEYDRSFHQLYPEIAVVTAIDPDHLDIYGNYENILAAFRKFVAQIKKGGSLIHKQGLPLEPIEGVKSFSYALQGMADFRAENIRQKKYNYIFDVMSPFGLEKDIELGLYGKLNLENAIAAYAACAIAGVAPHIIKAGLKTYQGIKRRFDVLVEQDNLVYIDDYAHHPEELRAFISSVRTTFKGLRICGIFQPHLYSRTRDFDVEFAQSLSLLDDVILLPIYPAREEAIPGVDSGIIFNKLDNQGKRILCSKEELAGIVRNLQFEVLLTMGAGDIDMLVEEIKETIEEGKT